ncbi:putative RNA-binding Zn ribbon-like protein [Mumia flava]|uniref:Putative RNA-binding Zn ribbon-like protein n=1 Tax=Mumia flava TaxID=1348852 RepID=A0A0B2BTV5_9ACTN|nr:CGNR zinc finger domain-containing protein [Mumia flava]PJJ56985.1 putative RNA-binding Zn ribbon-like protein [Mumia flava]
MSAYADAGPDPADRVVAFLNTLDVEDAHDALATVDDLAAWTGETSDRTVHHQALRLRDALRRLASGEAPAEAVRVGVTVEIGPDVGLRPTSLIEAVAADVATLTAEDRLARVKICPADDCRWAFYDRSKNHSRQWCSMEVCGNRAKARKHRARAGRG